MLRIKGLLGVVCVAFSCGALALPQNEQLQMTSCLASKLPKTYPVLAENKNFKIIDVPFADVEAIVRIADQAHCGRFINVTDTLLQQKLAPKQAAQLLKQSARPKMRAVEADYEIRHMQTVERVMPKVDSAAIWQTLNRLTSFYNRSATKDTGVEAAQWIKSQVDDMALQNGRTDVETRFVATGSRYKQPSLVTVIGKDLKKPGIVIGAHMDTLDGRMPGAGDDGSGSAVVLEMTRVLLSNSYEQQRPVYIVWYAAEERGLVGSRFVVQDFIKNAISVAAAIQFDMSGYRSDPNDPAMWVYQDFTDSKLNHFVEKLIKTYVKVPVKHSECGYACSDHASWMAEGIPASFPCESSFEDHNPYIHTSADDLNLLSDDHLTHFAQLAVAFAMEMSMK